MKRSIKCLTSTAFISTILITAVPPGYAAAASPLQHTNQSSLDENASKSLVPTDLEQVLTATGSHIAVLDTYALLVKQQPAFKFTATLVQPDVINKIGKDQSTTKGNANTWLYQIKPQIIQTNEDIFSFGRKFDNYYAVLMKAIDSANNKNLKTGIGLLYKDIQVNKQSVVQLIETLKTFRNAIVQDGKNFTDNSQTITKIFEENNLHIQQLQESIVQYQKNIDDGMIMIKEGSAKGPIGIGLMILGGILTALLDRTGISFTAAGSGLLAEGAAAVANGTMMMNRAKEELDKATFGLDESKKQVANLTLNKERLQTFTKEIDVAIQSAQSILNQWNTMDSKYDALLKKVEKATPDDLLFIKSQLSSTKKSWEDIESYADKLYIQVQYKG